MDMEIARPANVTWLPIPERQVVAMRALWLSAIASRIKTDAPPLPVPMLNWPQDLFQDDTLCH